MIKRAVTVAAVIALVATGGSAHAEEEAERNKAAESVGTALTPAEQDLVEWLEERGDSRFHAVAAERESLIDAIGEEAFAGFAWDGDDLIVHLAGDQASLASDATVHEWASRLPENIAVRVEAEQYSLANLEQVLEEVVSFMESTHAGQLVSAAVSVPRNGVEVEILPQDFDTIAPLLTQEFGDTVIAIQSELTALPERSANRLVDTSPFYGGLSTRYFPTPNYGWESWCTTNYAWEPWGTNNRRAGTAAHCYALDQAVYNAESIIGQVKARSGPAGPTDAALIRPPAGASFAPRVWVGARTTSVSWPVVSAIDEDDMWISSPIVMSGANGGETRGIVRAVNVTGCFPDGCTTGMTRIEVVSGGIVGGDSGGPCFSSAGGQPATVVARGIIIGPAAAPGQMFYCEPVFDISAILQSSIVYN